MAAVKEWQGIRYIMQVMIISLAWLSGIAFAQLEFSEAVTGSVSIPDGAIACLGNLAVFFTSLLRGRLDLENGVRDVLATIRGPKLREIERGTGLTTCPQETYDGVDVVKLSQETSNDNSIEQFMKYVYHSHGVASILLKILPLRDVKAEPCLCPDCGCTVMAEPSSCGGCRCIVLWTEEEEIRKLIDRRMPGTLKPLSHSRCLLLSWSCQINGCHGCNEGLLHVKQTEEDSEAESPEIHAEQSKSFRLQSAVVTAELHTRESRAAVCQLLHYTTPKWPRCCICIPVREAGDDEWTKLMIRFMRSKDQVTREVRVGASDAMEKYIDGSAKIGERMYRKYDEDYSSWFLIVPRLIEVLVNIILTGWLRVDGFSSALIARLPS